jgi:GDSL-like Lipase/Acylhydrolase family
MRRWRKIGPALLAVCFLAALSGGTVYGYFLHRNHLFPYRLLNPTKQQFDPWQSPWFRMRYGIISAFPVYADVVMLGDSLTEGADWRAILPGIDVTNQGIVGDTMVGLLLRLDLAERTDPRVVALMIGLNDLLSHQPVDEVYARYAKAIAELASPRRCIIVQSTLLTRRDAALNAAISDLDQRLAQACADGKCSFVDLNAVLGPEGELAADATVDGIHLTARGYTLWRDALLPHLGACLR